MLRLMTILEMILRSNIRQYNKWSSLIGKIVYYNFVLLSKRLFRTGIVYSLSIAINDKEVFALYFTSDTFYLEDLKISRVFFYLFTESTHTYIKHIGYHCCCYFIPTYCPFFLFYFWLMINSQWQVVISFHFSIDRLYVFEIFYIFE